MSNDYFDADDYVALVAHTLARDAAVNTIMTGVVAGFDKLPTEAEIKQDKVSYVAAGGVANVYTATLTYNPGSYAEGMRVRVKIPAGQGNTGPSTINFNTIGAVAIKRADGTDVEANDLPAGAIIDMSCDGTNFRTSSNLADVAAASTSATNAAASASAASTSAGTASSAASAASSSASAASDSASAASSSASAASGSASAASSSASSAASAAQTVVDNSALLQGYHEIYVPGSAFMPNAVDSPCDEADVDISTIFTLHLCQFPAGSDTKAASPVIGLPKSLDAAALNNDVLTTGIKASVEWYGLDTGAGTVKWETIGYTWAADQNLPTIGPAGTSPVTDTYIDETTKHIAPEQILVGTDPTYDTLPEPYGLVLTVERQGSADSKGEAVQLLGVRLLIPINAGNDE